MRTKLVKKMIDEHPGFGAGSGDTEWYQYECMCGQGKIIEEHDNIPGFRDHTVRLLCDYCNEQYIIDKSLGVRDWSIENKPE